MKTLVCTFLLFLFLFQAKMTAIDQVIGLKKPVIVTGKYFSKKIDENTFMTVNDGNGNNINLRIDSTLLIILKKYRSGDTIR